MTEEKGLGIYAKAPSLWRTRAGCSLSRWLRSSSPASPLFQFLILVSPLAPRAWRGNSSTAILWDPHLLPTRMYTGHLLKLTSKEPLPPFTCGGPDSSNVFNPARPVSCQFPGLSHSRGELQTSLTMRNTWGTFKEIYISPMERDPPQTSQERPLQSEKPIAIDLSGQNPEDFPPY